jgi:hypothetical protein
MDKMTNAYNNLVRKPVGRDDLEDLGADGKMLHVWGWIDLVWLRLGTGGRLL